MRSIVGKQVEGSSRILKRRRHQLGSSYLCPAQPIDLMVSLMALLRENDIFSNEIKML